MIQDIEPYKYDNTFAEKLPKDNDYIFIFDKDKVILHGDNESKTVLTYCEIKELLNGSEELRYIFSIDDRNIFIIANKVDIESDGFYKESTQIFRELEPSWLAFAGVTAYHLYNWYMENKYCGKCGNLMSHSEKERALVCVNCNNTVYPKISPGVIVGVINKEKILLTKYAGREYKKYALIAGFTEIGETLEDTVRREVMEEVGLKVKNIRYFKNQPWGFSSSLLVGFFADIDGDDNVNLDEEELSTAVWFDRVDMPVIDSNITLTGEMMEAFHNNKI